MIDLVYYDAESMMDDLIEQFEEGTKNPDTGEKISVTDADYDADIRALLHDLRLCDFPRRAADDLAYLFRL